MFTAHLQLARQFYVVYNRQLRKQDYGGVLKRNRIRQNDLLCHRSTVLTATELKPKLMKLVKCKKCLTFVEYKKTSWLQGLHPTPRWGAYSARSDP